MATYEDQIFLGNVKVVSNLDGLDGVEKGQEVGPS